MARLLLLLAVALPLAAAVRRPAPAGPPDRPRLLIAFASYRERPRHPKVYFYEHDGVAQGRIVGSVAAIDQRSDYHPSLSRDGRLCAFASERENQVGRIQLWDVRDR